MGEVWEKKQENPKQHALQNQHLFGSQIVFRLLQKSTEFCYRFFASRVQMWKPILPGFLYALCDTSAYTEESKSQVGYSGNRTEIKDK